jgi:hypothetical protein
MSRIAEMVSDDIQIAPPETHLSVADTLLRFGAGVDRYDHSLLASVFTDDASVDFRPCARKLGLEFPVLEGGEAITAFLAKGARTQLTSHVVSNTRVQVDGASSSSCSLVDANHLVRADLGRRLRMMNWYQVKAVKSKALWRIRSLVIDNVWFDGDPQILSVR